MRVECIKDIWVCESGVVLPSGHPVKGGFYIVVDEIRRYGERYLVLAGCPGEGWLEDNFRPAPPPRETDISALKELLNTKELVE